MVEKKIGFLTIAFRETKKEILKELKRWKGLVKSGKVSPIKDSKIDKKCGMWRLRIKFED